MKNFTTIIVFVLSVIYGLSEVNAQTWSWANSINGTDTTGNRAIACDNNNNVYIVGTFKGTTYFDSTHVITASAGCTDYYIVKYNQNHNLIWLIQGTTSTFSNNKWGRNIVFDNNGFLYILGSNDKNVSFNGGIVITPLTQNVLQGFILKVDTSGIVHNAFVYATSSENILNESITIDNFENLTVTGSFTGNISFQGGPTWASTGLRNHYIINYSNTFIFNWAKEIFGSNNVTKLISICTCTNEGFYIGGFFRGILTIDGITLNSINNTIEDIVLIKIDNLGNTLWVRQAGSTGPNRCNEIKSDNNGNLYFTGYGSRAMNFDSTGTALFDSRVFQSNNGYDCLVGKYNNQGDFLWAKLFGDGYDQIGYGISVNDNNIAITGAFTGTINWSNTISSGINNKDVFVGIIDINGIPLYCSKAGGTSNVEDRGERITFDNNNDAYISGYYNSNIFTIGNTNLVTNVVPDIFVAKYSTIKISSVISNVSCYGGNDGEINISINGGTSPFTYIWSDGDTNEDRLNLSSGTYSVTATDANLAKITHSFIVNQSPIINNPISASASSSIICSGASTTLSVNVDSSGIGANWVWYSGSCGGVNEGIGTSINVSPTITTTYYVRAEGTCNTTNCINKTINVRAISFAPTSANASPSVICKGSSAIITVNDGSLGSGSHWRWYTSSCGGTFAGAGVYITKHPTVTTTYYVRAEGNCNTTDCVSAILTVSVSSVVPVSASASPSTINNGSSTTLSVNGGSLGTNANWYWYSGSCGGTYVGIGDNQIETPTSTTTYYVRAEGLCNTTNCKHIRVKVDSKGSTSDIYDEEIANSNNMIIYPNPANNMINIKYSIDNKSNVKINLYNILGANVISINNSDKFEGIYNSEVDISNLPSGIYYCKMILDNNEMITKKIIISR